MPCLLSCLYPACIPLPSLQRRREDRSLKHKDNAQTTAWESLAEPHGQLSSNTGVGPRALPLSLAPVWTMVATWNFPSCSS